MNERAIAELLSSLLPSGRLNGCFESDAEIIRINGGRCLFTTDEFSEEDLFRETEPYLMGWNTAAGAISDIFACGGTPLYYAHALTAGRNWDEPFIRHYGEGVRDVLRATGTKFIGGDCGRSDRWRCTASVIGRCNGEPLLRTGLSVGDAIYLSGRVGAGNLEAALALGMQSTPTPAAIKNHFPLRQKESALIRRFASACIDTSDGVWSALSTLADLNECGYAVGDIPYLRSGADFCHEASIPSTMLFLGGCGEYELLFTVSAQREEGLQAEAAGAGLTFYRLGVITDRRRTLLEAGQVLDLAGMRIDPRDFRDPREYISKLLAWLHHQSQSQQTARKAGMLT